MTKRSAGLLPFRRTGSELEVFLVHPGGPFWKNKDAGVWSLVKGEYEGAEDAMAAARREFAEETGFTLDEAEFLPLGEVRQASGKVVTAWAVEQDLDPAMLRSNTFDMEWPPKSGKRQAFPEVDRAAWFQLPEARVKLIQAQTALLERLAERLSTI